MAEAILRHLQVSGWVLANEPGDWSWGTKKSPAERQPFVVCDRHFLVVVARCSVGALICIKPGRICINAAEFASKLDERIEVDYGAARWTLGLLPRSCPLSVRVAQASTPALAMIGASAAFGDHPYDASFTDPSASNAPCVQTAPYP